MGRAKKSKRLALYVNADLLGYWELSASGNHRLNYAESWLALPHSRPLSLSLPLLPSNRFHTGNIVENYFDNLLPDNEPLRRRIQTKFSVANATPFSLLSEIGRDCVGAVQLLPDNDAAPTVIDTTGTKATPLNATEIAERIKMADLRLPIDDADEDTFRISLAGAQDKLALLNINNHWHLPQGVIPTTHILKRPLGKLAPQSIDMRQSVANEWLCGEILRAFDIPVANSQIQQFADEQVLVVERFDRRWKNNRLWRLPQEDCCQALGVSGALKYQADGGPSIIDIMQLLEGSLNPQQDRYNFFKTQILFLLLAAIDGHAKNFSIHLLPQGRFQLTPCYDVMSIYPVMGNKAGQLSPQKAKMAMAWYGKSPHYHWQNIRLRHIKNTAERCGFGGQWKNVLYDIVQTKAANFDKVRSILPEGFPSDIQLSIFDGFEQRLRQLIDTI